MEQIYQATARRKANASRTTHGLVVVYHFLLTAALTGGTALVWIGSSPEADKTILEIGSGLAIFFALVYFMAGWGIWKWKSWSRNLSLILNWLNVVAAVLNAARLRSNAAGAVNVLLSCFVLWWLYVPAVKLQFRNGGET